MQALELSMLDAQQHSGAAVEHAGQEARLECSLPDRLRNMHPE